MDQTEQVHKWKELLHPSFNVYPFIETLMVRNPALDAF